jgi:hypothetical protein
MPAKLRMIHAGQAEHLDAGMPSLSICSISGVRLASMAPKTMTDCSSQARVWNRRCNGCPSTHSIMGQAITGNPGTKCTWPPAEAGYLVIGVGNDSGTQRKHTHVQAVLVVGSAWVVHGPAPAPRPACVRSISALAMGCRASATSSARAAHWRVWSSGVAPMPPWKTPHRPTQTHA